MPKHPIRVLVVDDSALVRQILAQGLPLDPAIDVVGTASDPYIARDKIIQLKPDVLTLDVEMPRMDGVAFLKRLMPQFPLPVVMVSALTAKGKQITIEALEAGAVDFVTKPSTSVARGLNTMLAELRAKIKVASTANVSHYRRDRTEIQEKVRTPVDTAALAESTDKVVAIGASTGGTEAIRKVLTRLPASCPGVVIVQHMPAGFTRMFAERMDQLCAMRVKEAAGGDRVMPGQVLIAPGGKHMSVIRSGGIYQVLCREGDLVNGHCPSVDVLMNSVAKQVGANAVGAILTGMGGDGGKGLLAMRRAGAKTLAQDQNSSVVFGMPKVAYELGGTDRLVPIDDIGPALLELLAPKRP